MVFLIRFTLSHPFEICPPRPNILLAIYPMLIEPPAPWKGKERGRAKAKAKHASEVMNQGAANLVVSGEIIE